MRGLAHRINGVSFAAYRLLCWTCTSEFNKQEALLDYQADTREAVASGDVLRVAQICFRFLSRMLWRSADEQRERLRTTDWGAREKLWKWGKAFLVLASSMFVLLCFWASTVHVLLLLVAVAVLSAFIIPAFFIDCALELDPHTERSGWSGWTRMYFALVATYTLDYVVYHLSQHSFDQTYRVLPFLFLAAVNYYLYNVLPARRA